MALTGHITSIYYFFYKQGSDPDKAKDSVSWLLYKKAKSHLFQASYKFHRSSA